MATAPVPSLTAPLLLAPRRSHCWPAAHLMLHSVLHFLIASLLFVSAPLLLPFFFFVRSPPLPRSVPSPCPPSTRFVDSSSQVHM